MQALLAQLDRVTGYEPVGRGFESLAAHQKRKTPAKPVGVFLFLCLIFFIAFFAVQLFMEALHEK